MTLGEQHLAFWLESLDAPSFVYVIQGDEGTPIKIGVAREPLKRLATLQTGNPQRLRLLYVLPGDGELEWQLHRKFKPTRILGEWYEPDRNALGFVGTLADKLVRTHDGSETPPDCRKAMAGEWRSRKRPKEVAVRYVEPDPVPEDEALENLKRRWLRPRRPGDHWTLGSSSSSGSIS